MKNFKKVLALVLAFAMVLSSLTAFAAEANKYEAEAKALYDLKLFKGTDESKFVPNLEGELSKGDALILMSYAFDWDLDSAKATEVTFKDVKSWQVAAVKYAVANGILTGNSAEEMGQELKPQALAALVLRQLGYDKSEAWVKAFELAMEEDLLTAAEISTATKAAKRDLGVGVFYKALSRTPQGETKTLIEKLVEAGKVDKDKAMALDLIVEEVAADFEVSEVSPLNLVETEVVFTRELDKDTVKKENFRVKNKAVKEAKLQDDKMTVLLFHDKVTNGSDADVKIKNVKDVDGTKVDSTEKTAYYVDNSFPEVVSTEVFGKRNIRITFTEPMNNQGDRNAFTVRDAAGKRVGVSKVGVNGNDNRAIDLTVSKDLKEEEYSIKINTKITDFAGYGLVDTVNVDVELLKGAPTVVGYEVKSATKVILEFDRDIDWSKSSAKLYHTNTTNQAKSKATGSTEIVGKKLTLEFNTNDTIPETAYIYLEAEALVDLYGNKTDLIKYKVEREEDTTAPEVESVEQVTGKLDKNVYFKITFVDDDAEKAKNKKYYTVKNEKGDVVAIRGVEKKADDAVVIELKDEVKGETTLIIDGLEDKQGNDMPKEEFTFTMADETQPKLSDAEVSLHSVSNEYILRIKYKEAMSESGDYSVLDLSKYQLVEMTGTAPALTVKNTYDLADVADLDIETNDDSDTVSIIIPDADINKSDDGSLYDKYTAGKANTWKLAIARVADAQDNLTKEITSGYKTVTLVAKVDVVDVDKVEAVSANNIDIYLTGKLDINAEDFKFVYDGNNQDISINTRIKDGNTVVEMELLNGELSADKAEFDPKVTGKSAKSYQIRICHNGTAAYDGKSTNLYGEKLIAKADISSKVADKIAPKFAKDTTVGTKDDLVVYTNKTVTTVGATTSAVVKVYFDEDMTTTGNRTLMVTDFNVRRDATDLTAGEDFTITAVTGKYIELTFTSKKLAAPKTAADQIKENDKLNGNYEITVGTDENAIDYVKDVAGNKVEKFEFSFDVKDITEKP